MTHQDLSGASPACSSRLPGGQRITINMPPMMPEGVIQLTIRQRAKSFDPTLDWLEARGWFRWTEGRTHGGTPFQPAEGWTEWLRAKVRGRANIVLLGSIGSSKTTGAEALIKEIPDWERLGTLESTPEWELDRRNWAPIRYAQERRPGIGLPTAEEALEMALRMRLDRVLFGELRNAEAWAWLRSLQTGLRGAIATAHGHPGLRGAVPRPAPDDPPVAALGGDGRGDAAGDDPRQYRRGAALRPRRRGQCGVPYRCLHIEGCAGAMNAALKALAEASLGTATVAAAWTAGASSAFLGIAGLWGHPQVPATDYLWGWWRYLPHAGHNTTVTLGLVLSAGAVAVPLLSLAILVARRRWRSLGGLRGLGQRLGQIRRASSNNHGQADWMTEARIDSLFPPLPHPEIGGVVVGSGAAMT